MKQTIFYGDLCYIKGYGSSTWEVIGYTLKWNFLQGKVKEEIIYVLSNVHTGENNIAYQDDLILVCRAIYAYDYIRQLDEHGSPPKMLNNKNAEKEKVEMTMTRKQKDDLLNELLDRYNDVQNFIKADGEINEHNRQQLEEIEAKLNEVNKTIVTR